MCSKAIESADIGQKVLFLVFNCELRNAKNIKSLLVLDLEEKFKDYENIKVSQVLFKKDGISGLDEIFNISHEYDHLMIDEFFDDFWYFNKPVRTQFEKLLDSKEIVWIALSNTYYMHYSRRKSGKLDPKKHFPPEFQIAEGNNIPLRMPANVAHWLKSKFSGNLQRRWRYTRLNFNRRLFAESTIPSNMVEGCKMAEFGNEKVQSLYELLDEAFKSIPKDKFALIIMDDLQINNILDSQNDYCPCKKLLHILAIDVALQHIGRPAPRYHSMSYSNDENEIKDWIYGCNRQQDLVTSYELVRGFENDIIIDITVVSPDAASRTSAQYINLSTYPRLDMLCVYENLLKKVHHCENIMDRNCRPKFNPCILSFFGENFYFLLCTFIVCIGT